MWLVYKNAILAKTCNQTINQKPDFSVTLCCRIESDTFFCDRFSSSGAQADMIKAKAGIKRISKCAQFLAKQVVNHERITGGHTRFNVNPACRTIGPKKHCFQMAGTLSVPIEDICQRKSQGFERSTYHLHRGNRFGKILLLPVFRWWLAWCDWSCKFSQDLIQNGECGRTEPGNKLRAFAAGHLLQCFQASPAKSMRFCGIKIKRLNREQPYRLSLLTRSNNSTITIPRQCAGRRCSSSQRPPQRKTLRLQAFPNAVKHSLFATKKMGNTCNIQ